ncbi:3-isopropylmalate dehydrogenase [compost metagenome]
MAQILSLALLLRYSLNETEAAEAIEHAINRALAEGYRTGDLARSGTSIGTDEMGSTIARFIREA